MSKCVLIMEGKDNAIDISVSFEDGKVGTDSSFAWEEANSEQKAMYAVHAFATLVLQGKIPAELMGAFIDMFMDDSVALEEIGGSNETKH